MKRILFVSIVFLGLCLSGLYAQKSQQKTQSGSGKEIRYDQEGRIKMVINKEMIDRFKSIEADENYITWNMIYAQYDWPTVRMLMAEHKRGDLDITNKEEVENKVALYQTEIQKPPVLKKPLPTSSPSLTLNDGITNLQ